MTPIKIALVFAALGAAAALCSPVAAQEPVVAASDPEALFTDKDPTLNANKQAVLHILREILQCNHWDEADKYLTERYLQHNPNVTSGRANVIKYFGPPPRSIGRSRRTNARAAHTSGASIPSRWLCRVGAAAAYRRSRWRTIHA